MYARVLIILISTYRFETSFSRRFGMFFAKDNEKLWHLATKHLPNFYSPMYTCTPLHGRLIPVKMMHVGSQPKMLLYTLNELFHVYHEMGADDDEGLHVVAQEMLSLTWLCCTEHRGKPMPSSQTSGITSTMVDVNVELLLEQLAWAIYDGVLELGHLPPLMGQHDLSQIMVGAYHLIYRGGWSKNHCPSCTMSSFSAMQTSRHARRWRGMSPLQMSTPQPWIPLVQTAISVMPRSTSSYSAEGATAAALDHVEEEEEEISFHEFHARQRE